MHYSYVDESGKMVEVEECIKSHPHFDQAMTAREGLIEKLADFDEVIANKYLMGEHITADDLVASVRSTLRHHNVVALH